MLRVRALIVFTGFLKEHAALDFPLWYKYEHICMALSAYKHNFQYVNYTFA